MPQDIARLNKAPTVYGVSDPEFKAATGLLLAEEARLEATPAQKARIKQGDKALFTTLTRNLGEKIAGKGGALQGNKLVKFFSHTPYATQLNSALQSYFKGNKLNLNKMISLWELFPDTPVLELKKADLPKTQKL